MKNDLNKKSILFLVVVALAISSIGILTLYAQGEDQPLNSEECGVRPLWRFGNRYAFGMLSEEQRQELANEINNLIESKMEEWGIEPPEPLLTEEQRTELKALIDELKAANATLEEMREAIKAKIYEWGIDLPEKPQRGQCFGKFFGRKLRMMPPLFNDES